MDFRTKRGKRFRKGTGLIGAIIGLIFGVVLLISTGDFMMFIGGFIAGVVIVALPAAFFAKPQDF
jgi:hypothetical protein